MNFRHVVTVNFQGIAIAFARGDLPTGDAGEGMLATDIYFNILALSIDSQHDAMDWTGFQPLSLPDAVRPAGMSLVNVPVTYGRNQAIEGLQDAGQPFRVVTDQQYLYLFRQAKKGTLLLNRLRLVRQTASGNDRQVAYALEAAWETRFQRSAKADIPADRRDSQSYLSMQRTPFLEPAFELFMIDGLSVGNFDVQFLPRAAGTLLTCAVFVSLAAQQRIDVYELPMDAAGLFALAGKLSLPNRDTAIAPDLSFRPVDESGTPIQLVGLPATTLYMKQERVRDERSNSFTVKRSGRLLIAHAAALADKKQTLLTVDLAVTGSGSLARPAASLQAKPRGVANYALKFDPGTYVRFPLDWAPRQHYSVDLWIYPMATTPASQLILGAANGGDGPTLCLLQGTAIEVGFKGKNGQPYRARTAEGSVRQQAWTRVQVSFDAKHSDKYQILLNGSVAQLQPEGSGDHPDGGAIDAIGATQAGFVGYIDRFLAYDGAQWEAATLVGEFPFDTIDYLDAQQQVLDPPQTPNQHDAKVPGLVYGAHLLPSTSPATAAAGALSWDSNGSTIYSAYFADLDAYTELNTSPSLLAGSDGLVHCYFEGTSSAFSVMQLQTESARAVFESSWSTRCAPSERGRLQWMALQPGAFMNQAKVEIVPTQDAGPANALFCDVTLTSPSGVTEHWQGLPRDLQHLAAAIAGDSVSDPDDPRLRDGSRSYFDAGAARAALYLPLQDNPSNAAIALVGRDTDGLTLAQLDIDADGDAATVTLGFAATRWDGLIVKARWPKVPLQVSGFLDTLAGGSSRYDYASGTVDASTYSLISRSELVAANRVVLFVRPGSGALNALSIDADADDPQQCAVAITLGETLTATWRRVPRAQSDFAAVLQGIALPTPYDYATLASGDYQKIGALLTIRSNGTDAMLEDVALGGATPVPPDQDLLVIAALFASFPTASYGERDRIPATSATLAAGRFQKATTGTPAQPLLGASSLLRAIPLDLPLLGGAAQADDTTTTSGGLAALSLQGFDGGWINQPEQRTLRYAWNNWVAFETDAAKAPGIDALTIAGDMSLELWCKPEGASGDLLQPFQRLLNFQRTPPQGGGSVRYMAALSDCPCLSMSPDTRLRAAFNTDAGTFYTWFQRPAHAAAGILGSIATIGAVQPVLQLNVDANGIFSLSFELDRKQTPIVVATALDTRWHALAVTFRSTRTVSGTLDYTFDVQLFLDGVPKGTQQYKISRDLSNEIDLATIVLGDIVGGSGLSMQVNEAALFGAVLDTDSIEGFLEQRIPDNASDLIFKWMLLEGEGNNAVNSAATGATYDIAITPSAQWQSPGLYSRPVLGYGDRIASLDRAPIIHGWSHLAMVHQAGHAVSLRGQFGDCGNDDTLNLGESFSIEAWVELATQQPPTPQCVLGKGDDYRLTLVNACPVFSVQVTIKGQQQAFSIAGKTPLAAETPTYLAATYQVATIAASGSDQQQLPRYQVQMVLYANGQQVASGVIDASTGKYRLFDDPVGRVYSNARLTLGRSSLLGGSAYLFGRLANVRVWSRPLGAAEIAGVHADRRLPAAAEGLVSWWRFDESAGRIAFDAKGDNDATLSSGNLRELFQATTTDAFFVNGNAVAQPRYLDSLDAIGGYGDGDQFLLGQLRRDSPVGFRGQIDEVRVWATQLTAEQLSDSMYRSLSGAEANLRGYWNFNNGSGLLVEDRSGRGNAGSLAAADSAAVPAWATSTAPLGNEAGAVLNVLGGVPTFAQQDIDETPSVVEYTDIQHDAYGDLVSVMKRAYVSVRDGRPSLAAGYKLGDLSTVYIGQAQSRPTLIGYIEGAPPLPSENQTLPYWHNGFGDSSHYAGAASVAFTESDNTIYAYNAVRDVADTHAFGMKGGLYAGGQYSTSAGIGLEVETPVMVFESHLGMQGGFELTDHKSNGIGTQSGTSQSLSTSLTPGGAWEPGTAPEDWLNPVVGRRYVAANTGVAMVKSLTVDVYASVLDSTGSTVKISMVPNPDIPVDVNLIDFPIDPTYVKNGTLDGKVGLRNDPSYPDADLQRGSYFKPLEAYALKRRIELESARLEAYYQQYDQQSLAGKLQSGNAFDDYRATIRNNSAYDWSQHLSKRSIVNTYVWTASGGGYAEQSQPMNVYSEQHGAISSSQWSLGTNGDVQMGFPVAGFYLDFDYLYTSATQMDVVRSKEQSSGFDLNSLVQPESNLLAATVRGDTVEFSSSPAEGKVDGYRYQAFMLAPDTANADTFFGRVVDPQWLRNSQDANAIALREATSAQSGPWRVLYRVTYVSRIPPPFQPVPSQSSAPNLQPPANLAYNAVLVQLVDQQIQPPPTQGGAAPTPTQIGAAIMALFGSASAPGPLANYLPWWPQFLSDSNDYALPAAGLLRDLREDLLGYMIATYAAKAGAAS